ncbi:GGDEF domain-containing protein [Geodermatophilus sp. URMC 64]
MPTALRARDPRAAARSARLVLAVCTVVFAGLTVIQQAGFTPLAVGVSWVTVAGLSCAALVFHAADPDRLDRIGAGPAIAVVGILLVCLLNLLTRDTSAAAQAFLAFPLIWAASHLRTGAIALVTGTAVLVDGVILFVLLPAEAAVADAALFGAVLVVIAVMLNRAGTTQERLVAALQEQATIDSLTGLVNRRVFDGALETAVTSSVAGGTGLVLIDVDAFKMINDSYGHPVGDDVLVHLARVLRRQVRADDAVLSRLGGDELAVLLPGCSADVAARRAEELLAAVRAEPLVLADGTVLALSISVGVAHLPRSAQDLRALYSAADAALYEAKRAGRGRVAVAAG